VVAYWDDIAHQTGLIISKEHYRKYIKPRQKDYFSCIKKYSNAKIYYHSCGAVYDFIPDLIEIGVDILNPIQVSAVNMSDTKRLKKEFEMILYSGVGQLTLKEYCHLGQKKMLRKKSKEE